MRPGDAEINALVNLYRLHLQLCVLWQGCEWSSNNHGQDSTSKLSMSADTSA